MDELLYQHSVNCFDTREAAHKIREKLLSTNVSMAQTAVFIQRRTSDDAAEKHLTKKEKHLEAHIMVPDVKHVTPKSVLRPSRTDSAPILTLSDRDKEVNADRYLPEHCSYSHFRQQHHEKTRMAH